MSLGIDLVIGVVIGFTIGKFTSMFKNTHVQIQQVDAKNMNMKASQTIIANNVNGSITMTNKTTALEDEEYI